MIFDFVHICMSDLRNFDGQTDETGNTGGYRERFGHWNESEETLRDRPEIKGVKIQ